MKIIKEENAIFIATPILESRHSLPSRDIVFSMSQHSL